MRNFLRSSIIQQNFKLIIEVCIKARIIFCLLIFSFDGNNAYAQLSNQPGTNGIKTYVNPILPGDHPDQTLMRVGNDFYSTGSNFHFTPYLPILHSTDLMHWEIIARVIPPTSNIPNNDTPSGGTWQGALAQFNNKFWVYFSNNAGGGQYFCNSTNMSGPWSAPVKVNTNTGVYGYDNSIFVDDDGTPYMLLKNGQALNGLQKLGMDGQPVGQAINMNWVNAANAAGVRPYSWAEGPVMCKRNGRYYLFVAGDVSGGQFVLSTANLTAGESAWARHGTFWQSSTGSGGFTGPNHVTQPVKLDDGTWWCLSHAYDNGGWEGQGRQSHLHQVIWDGNGVPKGIPVSVNPVQAPNLPSSGIDYNFIKSDYFESTTLSLNWHFLSKVNANTSKYSLSERPGYMRLKPGTGYTHLLQKDKGKYYSLTTKVDLNATANGQQAGIRMTSGNDDVTFTLYTGYNNGKKIGMAFQGVATEVNNAIGTTVWLRIERALHILTCFYSADGLVWTQLGTKDVSNLDKSQTDYNKWVGTSVGLYASAASADFDQFSYRYGFAPIRVEGRNNWYGVTFANRTPGRVVTNSTSGDWLMLAGVDLGSGSRVTTGIEVNVSSPNSNGSLEVWLDNIGGTGTKVSTMAIPNTGGNDVWSNVTGTFNSSGQHDVYLRWVGGSNSFSINTIRFLSGAAVPVPVVSITSPGNNTVYTEGENITINATAAITTGSISKVEFYAGTTLLGTDATSPYSYTITAATAGNYIITAKATSAANASATSTAVNIQVAKPIYQTGSAPVIDGTIDGLWSNIQSVSIAKNNTGTISSASDLSGNWKSVWDAANLYVLVQVTDDIKRNDGGTDVYNDDGVEIYMDMGNTKASAYGSNDHQYTFRWNDATAAYEINGHSVAGITKSITNTSTGYIVEVSIPWSTMGGSVTANSFQGFEVMLNDDDDGGAREGKLAWIATTDDTWSNPGLMGTIVLKGLNCTTPTAVITAGTPTTFCTGSNVVLNAGTGTGYSYVWKNGTTAIAGATAQTYTATTAGSYTVTVTNSGGCSATSLPTVVTVNALPSASITTTTPTTFCAGGNVTLNANTGSGLTYQWYNGSNTTGSGTASLSLYVSSGSFTVKVTDGNGCSSTSAPVVVTINALPSATITTTTPTTFCQGGSVVLTAGSGNSYVWKNGTTQVGTSQTYTATAAGSYTVEVTNTTNCKAISSATAVTVNALPAAAIITTTPTTFCQGGSVILTASSGSSYKWMNGTTTITGATAQSYTATAAGSYTVEVTNTTNCKAISSATTVTANALPTAAITANGSTAIPQGGSVELEANAGTGFTYVWYNVTAQVGTSQTYTATTAGSYTVEVTNAANCKAISGSTIVSINTVTTNQPSVITITSPVPDATVTGSIDISVDITDADGTITLVEFLDGNTVIGTSKTAPYVFTWDNPS
jgi:beta-xylosidase